MLAAALGLVAAVLFGAFAVNLVSRSGSGTLGNATFDVNAAFLARQVARDGPVLFQDLQGGDRDIYIQHLGADVSSGWRAFKATAPGQPRRCTLEWDQAAGIFRDTRCGSGLTFPADGAGLEQYRAVTQGNKLTVDLRSTVP